jgi:Bacterial cadherin-like domain/Matrixin
LPANVLKQDLTLMVVIDSHNTPIVLIAKTDRPQKSPFSGTVGSCAVVFKDIKSSVNGEILTGKSTQIMPGEVARHFFLHTYVTDKQGRDLYESMAIHEESVDGNKTSIIEQPRNGRLVRFSDKKGTDNRGEPYSTYSPNSYEYVPNSGFVGTDRVSFTTELAGRQIRSVIFIKVIDKAVTVKELSRVLKSYCPEYSWLVSNYDLSQDLAAWQRSAQLSALIANAQQTLTAFTDLPATALGQTAGEGANAAITLDTNAAGHGWYVDPTPLDNSDEYLPTSQAGVWQAKAGSAAANRMDMLSVLLHEYGHALGLEHSAEAGHFMNASLQPGMRKMPTAEQLAQMSQLVAQLKDGQGDALTPALSHEEREQLHDHDHDHLAHTEHDHDQPGSPHSPNSPLSMLGLLPLGFVRRNGSSPTTSNAGSAVSVRTHDYMTAVNPTLVNGKFHLGANTGANSGNGLQAWESFGAVQAAAGQSKTATVSITVQPVNDAPIASDIAITTPEDTPATITLIAKDVDTACGNLQFVIQNQPTNGTLTQNPDGSFYDRHRHL